MESSADSRPIEPDEEEEIPWLQFQDSYFHVWDEIFDDLTNLIQKRCLREAVQKMPLLDHKKLGNMDEWRRAHMVLSAIGNGYVWQNGRPKEPAKAIPKCLAVPWMAVSEHIGCRPVLSYHDCVLMNWKIKDKTRPLDVSNVETLFSLTGDKQEHWFFMVAFQVELEAAPGIRSVLAAQKAVSDNDTNLLKKSLVSLNNSIQKMEKTFRRVYDGCDPNFFYTKLAPFLGGWNSKDGLPDGLLFEGVSSEGIQTLTANAAQNSIFQTIDAGLGVEHTKGNDGELSYNEKLQTHMPRNQREFIQFVKAGPSIREYVNKADDDQLKGLYNACIESTKQFRNFHVQAVTSYVVIPASKEKSNDVNSSGGPQLSGLMAFLKELRNETADSKLECNQNINR